MTNLIDWTFKQLRKLSSGRQDRQLDTVNDATRLTRTRMRNAAVAHEANLTNRLNTRETNALNNADTQLATLEAAGLTSINNLTDILDGIREIVTLGDSGEAKKHAQVLSKRVGTVIARLTVPDRKFNLLEQKIATVEALLHLQLRNVKTKKILRNNLIDLYKAKFGDAALTDEKVRNIDDFSNKIFEIRAEIIEIKSNLNKELDKLQVADNQIKQLLHSVLEDVTDNDYQSALTDINSAINAEHNAIDAVNLLSKYQKSITELTSAATQANRVMKSLSAVPPVDPF